MNYLRNSLPVFVGIEFGRTTGYGYSFKAKPHEVITSGWRGCRFFSFKAPTVLLLGENQTFVAFGYEAENRYAELLEDEEHDEYYYFNDFHKLNEQKVTHNINMVEASGKSMDALKVLSIVIGFLRSKIIEELQSKLPGRLSGDDLSFVFTVPSFWNDDAKELIIEAASIASIKKRNVTVISDSEAAVVYMLYCQRETPVDCNKEFSQEFMIIQLSDETTDIAVYKKGYGNICEMIPTCSFGWGGKSINTEFWVFLGELFGSSVIKSLQEDEYEDYLYLSRVFDNKKRSIKNEQASDIIITLPISLVELVKQKHKKCENAIQKSIYKSGVIYLKQKLHIASKVFRGLFDKYVREIVTVLEKLLKDPKLQETKSIFMVGEFAECELIQAAISQVIKTPQKLIVNENIGSAVLRGAVLYGQQPVVITKIAALDLHVQVPVSKCAFCSENTIFYCHDCESAFCEQCRKKHDKLRSTRDHFVENVKNFDPTMRRPKIDCNDHKKEFVFSCLDCRILICSTCVTTKHSTHKIGEVSVIVSSARKNAEKQALKLKSQLQEINSQISSLSTTVLLEAKEDARSAKEKILKTVERITNVLQQKERFKMNITEDANNLQLQEINYSMNAMKKSYDNQLSVCQSIERLLDEKHDVTFYTTYNVLKQDIADLSGIANYQRNTQVGPFDEDKFLGDFIESLLDEFKKKICSTEDGRIVLKSK